MRMICSRKLRMSKWNVFLFQGWTGIQTWKESLNDMIAFIPQGNQRPVSTITTAEQPRHMDIAFTESFDFYLSHLFHVPLAGFEKEEKIYINWELQEIFHAFCITDIFLFKGWIPYPCPSMTTYSTTNVTHFPFLSL